jgi:phosphopantetheine--protein transferase-like protein
VPSENPTFISRNFTDSEISYCRAQPSFQASFAARWVGKEAVFKSLGVSSKGAGAAMKEIEILPNEVGVPEVTLHGETKAEATAKGISKIHLSLSHSDVRFSCSLGLFVLTGWLIDCRHCFRSSFYYMKSSNIFRLACTLHYVYTYIHRIALFFSVHRTVVYNRLLVSHRL